MRRRLLLLSLAMFIAVPAFADWEQAFREGVRLYERKKYADVVEFMKVAIQQKPVSDGASVNINGGFNAPYTPYHYMAAAYAQLGNCDEAANALRSAQGPAKNAEMTNAIQKKCGAIQTGPTQAELDAAAAAKKRADDAKKAEDARIAEENRKKAEDARIAEENRKKTEDARIAEENRKKAEDAKKAEDTRVAEERRKAEADNAAKALADETERARKAEEAKRAEATRLAEEQRKAAEAKKVADDLADAKKLFSGLVTRSKSLLSQSTDTGPARDALAAAVADQTAIKATTIDQVVTANTSLTRLYNDYLGVVTSGNSEKAATINFKAAIDAYMGGHYDQTLTLLAKTTYTGALKAQAALFKAASKFASSQLKGDSSPTTIAGIIGDVAEFRRLDPEAQLDVRVFSPAFRDFVKASAH